MGCQAKVYGAGGALCSPQSTRSDARAAAEASTLRSQLGRKRPSIKITAAPARGQKIASKGVPYVVAENMVLGTDHAEVGAQVLTQWSFPRDIIDAVRWHHDPDFPEQGKAPIDIVYLSNLLCQTNGNGSEDGGPAYDLSPTVIERLGIDVSQFDTIASNVSQWVDELADALTFN